MKLLHGDFSTRLNSLVLKDTQSNEIATRRFLNQASLPGSKETQSNKIANRQFLNSYNWTSTKAVFQAYLGFW